jgi:hypothetical protein
MIVHLGKLLRLEEDSMLLRLADRAGSRRPVEGAADGEKADTASVERS